MTELALLKMAHLLCLVYWLGGDTGVFYSSLFVVDEKRSPEVRVTVAKILFALDLLPRICMTMMLPTGVHLAKMMGLLKVPDAVVTGTWVVCLVWLALVLYLYFGKRDGRHALLTRVDFNFRIAVIAVLLGFSLYTLLAADQLLRDWVAYKVFILGLLVFCGLMIRVKLRPFAPAFAKLAAGNHDAADSRAVSRSLRGSRPFVLAIWAGILVNVALSVKLI